MAQQLKLRRGGEVSHLAFTGAMGEPTFNTESKSLHMHDGTTPGGIPQKLLVSVSDFGADKSGATSVSSAFEAAHDALPSAGGMIFVPRGVYLLGTALTFTKPVLLCGEGHTAVAGGVAPSQIYKGSAINGPGIVFEGLCSGMVRVGVEGKAGNGGDGVQFLNGRSVLRDVSVHRMGRDGIRVGSDSTTFAYNCNHGDHSHVICRENGRYGYYLNDGYYMNDQSLGANVNSIRSSHFDCTANGSDGIRIEGAWYNCIETALCQVNDGYGINIVNSGGTNIGARYNYISGGDHNEGNALGEIRNTGFNTVLCGVTPGGDASGLIEAGINTIVVSPGLSQFDALRVTNFLTTERPTTGTLDFPLIVKVFGNSNNGRGGGVEIQVPNGSGTARAAGRIAAAQTTTNTDYLSFFTNDAGVMTETIRIDASLEAMFSAVASFMSLGRPGNEFKNAYLTGEVYIDGDRIIRERQAAIADSSGGDEQAKINAILAALRAHGLIAT